MHKLLGNVALVFFSIILTLGLAELALRLTPYANIPSYYSYPPGYFFADAELAYDITKNSQSKIHQFRELPYPVFSNHLGCFDKERPVPSNYTLVVGDSFAWGYTPLEKKWTTLLENKSGQFILKCGVTGYGIEQELIKAKRVVSQVGIHPKLLIVLYSYNDLNDSFMFPHRTVYGDGYLVSTRVGADLKSGIITSMSPKQIQKKYAKYVSGSWSQRINHWAANSVLYRLWFMSRPAVRAWKHHIKQQLGFEKVSQDLPTKTMPDVMNGAYGVDLDQYLDTTDRPWYNQLIARHSKTLEAFANYAHDIDATLVVVDIKGTLSHPRFSQLQSYWKNHGAYYYNLANDYPKQSTWQYDAHWNIEGNAAVAQFIQHFLTTHRLISNQP